MSTTTPDRWREVRDLFEAVVDLPPAERDAELARRSGADAELARMVSDLLAADTDGRFLAQPRVRAQGVTNDDPLGSGSGPVVIGDFTVRRLIAAGGMGAVYEAEQARPQRAVALKVLRPELCTGSTLRRFQVEAEILGRLRHPSIAEIIAAGVHEVAAGPLRWNVPWYAMELLESALPITEFADRNGLATRARVELVRRTCAAVHHAHQKGVIHRDLKPGNVLVDAGGTPKVIDFGIARATAGAEALHTEPGLVLGTPSYMAPEQFDGHGSDVDVRCDVFALGVILYSMLSGRLPFDVPRRISPQPAALAFAVAPRRLAELAPGLPVELDWIAQMAIAVDRERRYETAAALADDLERFLRNEAVAAAPASRLYELRKSLRRHRGLVASVVAVVLSLGVGLVATSRALSRATSAEADALGALARAKDAEAEARAQQRKAERARSAAEAATTAAAEENQKSRGVLQILQAAIGAARGRQRGENVSVASLCIELASRLEADTGMTNIVRATLANYLGELHFRNGEYARSEALLRRALGWLESAGKLGGWDEAVGRASLSEALRLQGKLAESWKELEEALAVAKVALQPDDPIHLSLRRRLVFALLTRGETETAIAESREVLQARQERFGAGSREVAESRADLLAALLAGRHYEEAEPVGRSAVETCRTAYGASAEKTLNAVNSLGIVLLHRGSAADAAALLSDGHAAAVEAHGPKHPLTALLRDQLSFALMKSGDASRAADLLAQALADRREAARPDDKTVLAAVARLAEALVASGRAAEAEQLTRPHAEVVPEAEAGCVESVELRRFRSAALRALARDQDAEATLRAAHELAVSRLGAEHASTRRVAHAIATLCQDAGRAAEAAAWNAKAENGAK